jgi:adenine-specific DNA-methyltransferase
VLIENLRTTAKAGEVEPEFTLFDRFDGLDALDLVDFYSTLPPGSSASPRSAS